MIRGGAVLRVPGDKSVSHRALLFGALAQGTTRIRGLLDAEDVGRTREAVRALGCDVEEFEAGSYHVTGHRWRDVGAIDCGNSGTTTRLLLGALAGRAGATLSGDASLNRRPMMRVVEPLRAMGASIEGGPTLPLRVARAELRGIRQVARMASAQVKSAILLAGLEAVGETTYVEPVGTRDHTERMLYGMGARLRTDDEADGKAITIEPGRLEGAVVDVPGDISSAAFWLVAAAIHPGVELTVKDVGLNPTRTGILDVLGRMGATLQVDTRRGIEPIGEVRISAAGLRGIEIGGADIPRLIDELPVIAVAAAFAEGETVVRDAAELRVKESDRIATVVAGLRAIGVEAEARPDGFVVRGGGARAASQVIATEGDHRIAMAFSIAGLRAPCRVSETDSIRTSYPGFLAMLASLARDP